MGNWDEHGKRSRSEQHLLSVWKRRKISCLAHNSPILRTFEAGKGSLALPIESFFHGSPLEANSVPSSATRGAFPFLSPLPRPLQGPQRMSIRRDRTCFIFAKDDKKDGQWKRELASELQSRDSALEQVVHPENMPVALFEDIPDGKVDSEEDPNNVDAYRTNASEFHNRVFSLERMFNSENTRIKLQEDILDANLNTEEDLSEVDAYRRMVHERERYDSSLLKDSERLETNFELRGQFEWHAYRNKAPLASVHNATTVSLPTKLQQGMQYTQPIWKQLQSQVRQSDFRIKQLNADIQLVESKLSDLQVTRKEWPQINSFQPREHEIQLSETFTTLSRKEEKRVNDALSLNGINMHELLVVHENSNIELTRTAMRCLLPGGWLNDEVINLYLELLKERELGEPKKFLKCHFFNTFFFNKLYRDKCSYDFKAVRRWTMKKKLRYTLLDCDKVFVPIHKDIHWCLAVINIRDKKLEYLDSLPGKPDKNSLEVLARYISDEAKDKSGKDVDVNTWEKVCHQDIPRQFNGCDCGMFMVKYIDFHSRDIPLKFTQEHMEYFRRRMILELLQLKAN